MALAGILLFAAAVIVADQRHQASARAERRREAANLRSFPHHDREWMRVGQGHPELNVPQHYGSLALMHEVQAATFEAANGFGSGRLIFVDKQMSETSVLHDVPYQLTGIALLGIRDPRGASAPPGWQRLQVAGMSRASDGSSDVRTVDLQFEVDLSPDQLQAVHGLLRGSEVVLVKGGDEALALGALRAKAACARCHGVQEQTLLGALLYRLEPAVKAETVELPRH